MEAAAADPSIVLLSGDLGFGVLDEFRNRFPAQFVNVGVAEQNMASLAAGLGMTGHKVFTYSIANFPTLRCLEQLRNDVCYHAAPVVTVAVGGGMAYGALGPSHFATEDLAILRALPEMTVLSPGDPHEVRALLPQLLERGGPAYLRLGRAGEPKVHASDVPVVLGQPTEVLEGADVCLLATGGMLPVAMEVGHGLLERHGVAASLFSVHTLKPLNEDALVEAVGQHPAVVTLEEHTVNGGLGGAVAEVLLEAGLTPRFLRVGLPPAFPSAIGSQEYLRSVLYLDAPSVQRRVHQFLSRGI